jgi:hypothetical protein
VDKTVQPPKTLRSDALQAIEDCAGWNSRLASRRITQFLEKRMIGSGLTIAQFGLMAQIATASEDTLGALAERLGLDQSSLSRNLHALERDGFTAHPLEQIRGPPTAREAAGARHNRRS